MTMDSTKSAIGSSEAGHFLCDDWFDPLETGVRKRIRGFIEELLEAELDAVLGRDRYERPRMGGGNLPIGAVGSRHGHRERGLMGTFGGEAPAKLSGSMQRNAREHYAVHAARTAFQISGALFVFDAKLSEFELTFPDPMHEFNAGDGDRCALKALQSEHWTQTKFDRPVILLDQIVQIFRRSYLSPFAAPVFAEDSRAARWDAW